jgi:hypothetical protein
MTDADKPQFASALKLAFSTFRQPLPTKEVLDLWWQKLSPYPVQVVARAFDAYFDEGSHPPVPADIVKRCNASGHVDRRPGSEEAWAIAMAACDENETVVMNNEIAEARGKVQPILDAGDEVGARVAFREIYTRLVAQARADGIPAVWWPSVGRDLTRRKVVLQKAVSDGLLHAHTVSAIAIEAPAELAPLLAAPAPTANGRETLDALKKLLAGDPEGDEQRRQARLQAEREAVNDRKVVLLHQAQSLGLSDDGYGDLSTSSGD